MNEGESQVSSISLTWEAPDEIRWISHFDASGGRLRDCSASVGTTHNDLRFAADALSGWLSLTIYAKSFKSVRRDVDSSETE